MPTRAAEERALSHAEARRRARLAARGDLVEDEDAVVEDTRPPEERRGILSRLFPPAPPLPNRRDPLEKFDRSGPLRPIRERLYLLRRNLLAWMIPSLVAFLGFFGSSAYRGTILEPIGTFALFGSLIAAGWFGWQRPALFGATSALVAYVLWVAVVITSFAQLGGADAFVGTLDAFGELGLWGLYLTGLGFIGGWYGGYLRRRQAHATVESRRPAARRRR
jgi:hypothetical protein